MANTLIIPRRDFLLSAGALTMSLNWSGGQVSADDRQENGGLKGLVIGLTPTAKVPAACSVASTQQLWGTVLDPAQLATLRMILRRPDDQVLLAADFQGVEIVRSCVNVLVCQCHVCKRRRLFCIRCRQQRCVCQTRAVTTRLSVRAKNGQKAYVSFHFQGQHIAEASVSSAGISCKPGGVIEPIPIPFDSYLSEPSRLVFQIPQGVLFNLSLEGMLDWSALQPSLVPVAIPNVGLILPNDDLVVPPSELKDKKPRKPNPPGMTEPEKNPPETSIVIPNGMEISPHGQTHWRHAIALSDAVHSQVSWQPQTKTVEVWETHNTVNEQFLDKNSNRKLDELQTVRAVWAEEVVDHGQSIDQRLDLLPNLGDRKSIVHLNANFAKGDYKPTPLICSDLRLSPGGGSVKLIGDWPFNAPGRDPKDPEFGCVVGYKQHTNRGRDQYVRVERFYFGCPVPVVIITIEERIRRLLPCKNSKGAKGFAEILLKRWFSKHIAFPDVEGIPDGQNTYGRRWPFRSTRFDWPDNVELKQPEELKELEGVDPLPLQPFCQIGGMQTQIDGPRAFWLYEKCSMTPMAIPAELTDAQGRRPRCEIPMMAIRADIALAADAPHKAQLEAVLSAYYSNHHLREIDFREQAVGFVPVNPNGEPKAPNKALSTVRKIYLNVEFDDINWSKSKFPNALEAETPSGLPSGKLPLGWNQLAYYPAVSHANITLREVATYSSSGDGSTFVGWNPFYNKYGFAPANNSGEVFLDLIRPIDPSDLKQGFQQATAGLDFPGSKGGGLATPSLNIASVSRRIGAVGGQSRNQLRAAAAGNVDSYTKNSFVEGSFKPQEFIPTDAKLIGGITLKDLLAVIAAVSDLAELPKLATDELADLQDVFEKFNEVRQAVEKALGSISKFAEFAAQLKKITDAIHSTFGPGAFDGLKRVIDALKDLVRLPDDVGDNISLLKSRAIFEKSFHIAYPRPPSEGIDQLYKIVRLENLMSVLDAEALIKPLVEEIKGFRVEKSIRPLQRVENLVTLLKSPESLLEGTFTEELDRLITDLNVDADGVADLLQGAVDDLIERVVRGIRLVGSNFSARVSGQVLDPIRKLRGDYLPVFTTVPAAQIRYLLLEEYLSTGMPDFLAGPTEAVATAVEESMHSLLTFDEKLLKSIANILQELRGVLLALNKFLRDNIDKIPKSISVKYDWDTPLTDFLIFVAKGITNNKTAKFAFHTRIEKKLGISQKALSSPPTFDATVTITDFQIKIIPSFECITIGFDRLSVQRKGNGDTDVKAVVNTVELGQSLSFVQDLAKLFAPSGGFYYQFSTLGITAGYAIPVPAFTVGVFALSDLAIGVGFQLPFDGNPISLDLSLSRRDKPCLLAVGILGGTAFFRIVLQPDSDKNRVSITELEAALEFGAVIVADFSVARGMLYVFGGIYYGKLRDSEVFRAYVRAGGSLDVLSLITASIEFYLGLTYEKSLIGETSAYGTARVSIRVKIIFVINICVTLTYEKRFIGSKKEKREVRQFAIAGGAGAEPVNPFRPIDVKEWTEYSQLFA